MGANRAKPLGYFFAGISVLVWGTTFIVTKQLLNYYTPLQIMCTRFGLAYLFLWILRPRRLSLKWQDELCVLLSGLFSCSLYFWAENTALVHTLASNISIIVSAAPILTAILAALFAGERLRSNTLIGFFAAFAGVVLVVLNGGGKVKFNLTGDLLALLAAACWAVYSVIVRNFTAKYDTILLTRRIMFWGGVTAIPMCLAEGKPYPLSPLLDSGVAASLLFLGLVGSAICYVLWNEAFNRLGIVATNSFIYAIPFVTMVAAALVLKETITPTAVAGAVLITAGVMVSERRSGKIRAAAES